MRSFVYILVTALPLIWGTLARAEGALGAPGYNAATATGVAGAMNSFNAAKDPNAPQDQRDKNMAQGIEQMMGAMQNQKNAQACGGGKGGGGGGMMPPPGGGGGGGGDKGGGGDQGGQNGQNGQNQNGQNQQQQTQTANNSNDKDSKPENTEVVADLKKAIASEKASTSTSTPTSTPAPLVQTPVTSPIKPGNPLDPGTNPFLKKPPVQVAEKKPAPSQNTNGGMPMSLARKENPVAVAPSHSKAVAPSQAKAVVNTMSAPARATPQSRLLGAAIRKDSGGFKAVVQPEEKSVTVRSNRLVMSAGARVTLRRGAVGRGLASSMKSHGIIGGSTPENRRRIQDEPSPQTVAQRPRSSNDGTGYRFRRQTNSSPVEAHFGGFDD